MRVPTGVLWGRGLAGGWWGAVFLWRIGEKGEGGGEGGVGTGKGTGKSMRKLCRNYPLANYRLVSPLLVLKQKRHPAALRAAVKGRAILEMLWKAVFRVGDVQPHQLKLSLGKGMR